MKNNKHILSLNKNDFEISYFSGSGSGGQHRNKHQNCVRIKHIETGIIAVGQNQKSKEQNKKEAFSKLTKSEKFKSWLHREAMKKIMEIEDIEKKVNSMMSEENLIIEFYDPESEIVRNKNNRHPSRKGKK